MRILLFLATNAAVLVVISVVFKMFGLEGILAENGVDLNLQALLVMSAIIGFGGSFISLAMSKFMASAPWACTSSSSRPTRRSSG